MNKKLLPLALMYAEEGSKIEGRTRLQKLVFLLEQELQEQSEQLEQQPTYDFIPYDYGPFSKELYDELDRLRARDFIEVSEEKMDDGQKKYDYKITEDGKEFVRRSSSAENRLVLKLAESLKQEYNDVLLSNLIEEVYSEFPEYAENSVW